MVSDEEESTPRWVTVAPWTVWISDWLPFSMVNVPDVRRVLTACRRTEVAPALGGGS